ncbi:Stp1/IreP family PP2C-type Ser/Thr phosphatase [Proteinivorax hydrogeniformans]|uniref:Stp1/IreP family PP2C-type Ser/Thr phosphatase n=1 Tax=Proteinivorax hydrogeniformans TaxID=1826727 RepID=A0AAU8HPY7_9FIRM
MKIGGKTHCGYQREINQDYFVYGRNGSFSYIIVADGMGGHLAGEIASKKAVNFLANELENNDDIIQLKTLIEQVNEELYKISNEKESLKGMGTTLSVVIISNGYLNVGHVGDSRVYLLRDKQLLQLTNDHSLVADLVRHGQLTEEEAEKHPQRNVLTQAVGTDSIIEVQSRSHRLKSYDKILLCTDGLTKCLTDTEIAELMMESEVEDICDKLIGAALNQGGTDNVTVAIADVGDIKEVN